MSTCYKSYTKTSTNNKYIAVILVSIVAMTILASLLSGAVLTSPKDIFEALFGTKNNDTVKNIIMFVRLPRTIGCILVGAALAISGLLLQSMLNNPLASPGVIGINTGAGFFVVAVSAIAPNAFEMQNAAAFVGAVFTTLLVYGIAKKAGGNKMTIIMAGIAVSSLMTAAIDAIVTFLPETVTDKVAFYIGGFHGIAMEDIWFSVPYIVVGLAIAIFISGRMNIFVLGDEMGTSLGLPMSVYRFIIIITISLLAGGAISMAGLLGFVGLIVPHIARIISGHDHRWLVPISGLLGAELTLGCDILARSLFTPFELPVGILLSFIGGPFFLYLLLTKKRSVL